MQPYDMKELEERVILVGVQESFSEDVEESLDELAELCETAGALVVGRVIQNREKIHPGTYSTIELLTGVPVAKTVPRLPVISSR